MSNISFNSDINDIDPDDSSSRRGVFYESNNVEDNNISITATSSTKTSKSGRSGLWDQSNLIFVKDDKHESNVDYLEGLIGVFQSLL